MVRQAVKSSRVTVNAEFLCGNLGLILATLGSILVGISILLVLLGYRRSSDPEKEPVKPPVYTSETDLIWFIQAAGCEISDRDPDLLSLLKDVRKHICPSFLVMAGGLVSARGAGRKAFWKAYRELIWAAFEEDTLEFYHDLAGAGDVEFLTESIQGPRNQAPFHSWSIKGPGGNHYHFVCLNTVSRWHARGRIADACWKFLVQDLSFHSTATTTIVFGHHPLSHFGHRSKKDDLIKILLRDRVTRAYFSDYLGSNWGRQFRRDNQYFHEIATKGLKHDENYRIVALPGTGVATNTCKLGVWPQVLIVTPLDLFLGGSTTTNPQAPRFAVGAQIVVKALIFADQPLLCVKCQIGENPGAIDLTPNAQNAYLYEGVLNSKDLLVGIYPLKVTAKTQAGENSHQVTVQIK